MKRFLSLALLIVALSFAVLPAAAQSDDTASIPLSDLTALARVMPDDAVIFGAFRIDDGYIAALDAAYDRIEAVLPGLVPATGLRDQLNELSKPLGGTFEQVFGAWLGDTAAFAIDDLENGMMPFGDFEESITLAVDITDQAAAVEYFDFLIAIENFRAEKVEDGDTVRYDDLTGDSPISIFVHPDMIIIGQASEQMDRSTRLSMGYTFLEAFAALPQDAYNIGLYIDMARYFDILINTMDASMRGMSAGSFDSTMRLYDMMGSLYGGMAMGFTILDERSFVMDASVAIDYAAYEDAFGIDALAYTPSPVDPAFARHIPVGTPLIMHGSDLAASYNGFIAALESQAISEVYSELGIQDIDQIIGQLEFGVRGATGLTLEEIFGWMEGDYAIWLSLSSAVTDATDVEAALLQALPIDFGMVVDATPDPQAAAALVGGMERAFEFLAAQSGRGSRTTIEVSEVEIEGAAGVTLTITDPNTAYPIEISAASNDEVFVLGTPRAVRAALNPMAGMDSDPAFVEAAGYLLPDTMMVVYAAGGGFARLSEAANANPQDEALLAGVFAFLNSSSVSQTLDENGVGIARFVITLPE
jgi:hypothetical protein